MTEPVVRLVDAVPPAANPGEPSGVGQAHAELPLDEGGPRARGLLLVPEALDGRAAGVATRRLVRPREEALVPPLAVVRLEEILERRVEAGGPPAQVVLDDAVERLPVHHRVVAADRHAQDVHVAVLQRAGLVVVDLAVAELEHDVGAERRLRLGSGLGGGRERPQVLQRRRLHGPGGVAREIERLQDELADLSRAPAPVVARRREMERFLRPRHRDVEEPPLLLEPEVRRRRPVPEESRRAARGRRRGSARETGPGPAPRRTPPETRAPWPCAP